MTRLLPIIVSGFILLSGSCAELASSDPAEQEGQNEADESETVLLVEAPLPTELSLKISTPLEITEILSSDLMAGRETGTPGSAQARFFIQKELKARGLEPHQHKFTFLNRDGSDVEGINLLARIDGKSDGPVMVITAHYDHVGVQNGEVFNGADDNASGVAGAFAVADHFLANPPEHSVVFAFLDAEEAGLHGAHALVRDGLPSGGDIAFNMNFDMLSKNDKNELYAAGAHHRPWLEPMLKAVAEDAPIDLKLGHDDPSLGPREDWTLLSDHGAFHRAGIPFVYFGVEDHGEYHKPTDDFETIPQDFFLGSIETVILAAERIDADLGDIAVSE